MATLYGDTPSTIGSSTVNASEWEGRQTHTHACADMIARLLLSAALTNPTVSAPPTQTTGYTSSYPPYMNQDLVEQITGNIMGALQDGVPRTNTRWKYPTNTDFSRGHHLGHLQESLLAQSTLVDVITNTERANGFANSTLPNHEEVDTWAKGYISERTRRGETTKHIHEDVFGNVDRQTEVYNDWTEWRRRKEETNRRKSWWSRSRGGGTGGISDFADFSGMSM